jgi:hypothetical protein
MKVLPLVLLFATFGFAQEQTLPAHPSPQHKSTDLRQLTLPTSIDLRPSLAANADVARPVSQPRSNSVLKSPSFWLMLASATAATVADCESTKARLSDPNIQETNLIFGSRPSRARLYGISIPLLGLNAFVSAELKRRHIRAWPALLGVVTGVHGAAAIHNSLQ